MCLCLCLCVNACLSTIFNTERRQLLPFTKCIKCTHARVSTLYIQRARAGGWGLDWNIQKHKEDRRKNKPNERENTRTDTPNQTELKPKSNERRVETCVLYILRAAAAAVTQWHYWWLWLLLRLLPSLLLFFWTVCKSRKEEWDGCSEEFCVLEWRKKAYGIISSIIFPFFNHLQFVFHAHRTWTAIKPIKRLNQKTLVFSCLKSQTEYFISDEQR